MKKNILVTMSSLLLLSIFLSSCSFNNETSVRSAAKEYSEYVNRQLPKGESLTFKSVEMVSDVEAYANYEGSFVSGITGVNVTRERITFKKNNGKWVPTERK